MKKADIKETTTVKMSREQKIKEGQILLNDLDNYWPLEKPMADETDEKIKQLTTSMLTEGHIDEMTIKWLSQTLNPPRIPEFYTLTTIQRPTLVGRPMVSGCDGPERENLLFCRPPHIADSTTRIVSERFKRFYKLHSKHKTAKEHNPCLNLSLIHI